MQNSVLALKHTLTSYQNKFEREQAYLDQQRRQLLYDWSMYQHAPTHQQQYYNRQSSSAPSKRRECQLKSGQDDLQKYSQPDQIMPNETRHRKSIIGSRKSRSHASRRKLHSAGLSRSQKHLYNSNSMPISPQNPFVLPSSAHINPNFEGVSPAHPSSTPQPAQPPKQELITNVAIDIALNEEPDYIVEQRLISKESIEQQLIQQSIPPIMPEYSAMQVSGQNASNIDLNQGSTKDIVDNSIQSRQIYDHFEVDPKNKLPEQVESVDYGPDLLSSDSAKNQSRKRSKSSNHQNLHLSQKKSGELQQIEEEIGGGGATPDTSPEGINIVTKPSDFANIDPINSNQMKPFTPSHRKSEHKQVRYSPDLEEKVDGARNNLVGNGDINSPPKPLKNQYPFSKRKQQSPQHKVSGALNSDITNPFPSTTNFMIQKKQIKKNILSSKSTVVGGFGKVSKRSLQTSKAMISSDQASGIGQVAHIQHKRHPTGEQLSSQKQQSMGQGFQLNSKNAVRSQLGQNAEKMQLSNTSKRSEPLINVDQSYVLVNDLQKQIRQVNNVSELSQENKPLPTNELVTQEENTTQLKQKQQSEQAFDIPIQNKDIELINKSLNNIKQIDNQNPLSQTENQIKPKDSNIQEKEKWQVVMNFMENNPNVMIDMMSSHPEQEEHRAADGIQNQLYNSTSKQYLNSRGNLKYQNYEVFGKQPSRQVLSNDSNKSPPIDFKEYSKTSQDRLLESRQIPYGGRPSFTYKRAKSSINRTQKFTTNFNQTSNQTHERDFLIKTNSSISRPTTSTQQKNGFGHKAVQGTQLWQAQENVKQDDFQMGAGHLQRPSTTAGVGRPRGNNLENLVDRSAQYMPHELVVASFRSDVSPGSKIESNAIDQQFKTRAQMNNTNKAINRDLIVAANNNTSSILEVDKLQFAENQLTELDYKIRKAKLIYRAQIKQQTGYSQNHRMSLPSTVQGSARLREKIKQAQFAYNNKSLLQQRNLTVLGQSKQTTVIQVPDLPIPSQKQKMNKKSTTRVGFPKRSNSQLEKNNISHQDFNQLITALDNSTNLDQSKIYSNIRASAALADHINHPINSFINKWPKPKTTNQASPVYTTNHRSSPPNPHHQKNKHSSPPSHPSQLTTAFQSVLLEKQQYQQPFPSEQGQQVAQQTRPPQPVPRLQAIPIASSSMNRLDPHKYDKFGQQWLTGAAVGKQQAWVQEAEQLLMSKKGSSKQQNSTQDDLLMSDKNSKFFLTMSGKNKHERRLQRLKGLRQNIKLDIKQTACKLPDSKSSEIISLEQKQKKSSSKLAPTSPKTVITVVEKKSEISESRNSSPTRKKLRKSKKLSKHNQSKSLKQFSKDQIKKQSSQIDFSKDAVVSITKSKHKLNSPQADGYLDSELIAIGCSRDHRIRPKTGIVTRKSILKDGRKSIITDSSQDQILFKTCDILRKQHKYGNKKTGELYQSSEDKTSHTHETCIVGHRIMGQSQPDEIVIHKQNRQSPKGLIKTSTGLVVQQTRHQIDYCMAHERKRQAIKTDSSAADQLGFSRSHIGQKSNWEGHVDSQQQLRDENYSSQQTRSLQGGFNCLNDQINHQNAQNVFKNRRKTDMLAEKVRRKNPITDKIVEEPVSILDQSISLSYISDEKDIEEAAKLHPFRKSNEDLSMIQDKTPKKSPKNLQVKTNLPEQSPREKQTLIVSINTPEKHIFTEDLKDTSSEEEDQRRIQIKLGKGYQNQGQIQKRRETVKGSKQQFQVQNKQSNDQIENISKTQINEQLPQPQKFTNKQMVNLNPKNFDFKHSSFAYPQDKIISKRQLVVDEADHEESSSNHSSQIQNKQIKSKRGTPRAIDQQIGFKKLNIMESRAIDRRVLADKPKKLTAEEAEKQYQTHQRMRFDWTRMALFRKCTAFKRLEKPPTYDINEHKIMNFIQLLRENPAAHQQAHKLMPMLEVALDYLEEQLCNNLNMEYVFKKVKQQQRTIDYKTTLKTLIRAKLTAQMKEDMTILICRYLDILEELRQLQILRDDMASDNLIKDLLHRVFRHATSLQTFVKKFKIDYPKLFGSGQDVVWIGRTDLLAEVDELVKDLTPLVDKELTLKQIKYVIGPEKQL